CQRVVSRLGEHGRYLTKLTADHADDDIQLGVHVFDAGLGEDGANGGGGHLRGALRAQVSMLHRRCIRQRCPAPRAAPRRSRPSARRGRQR
ncbi:MAG: hypothetical protein JWM61_1536, partial [Micrococcaceae bacterium]|nr:hypothetical protein [Micrococcaceae bacterium]